MSAVCSPLTPPQISPPTVPWYKSPIDKNSDLYLKIKELKKAELHTHLTGGLTIPCLRKIAGAKKEEDFVKLLAEKKRLAAGLVSYKDCFKYFVHAERILGVDKPATSEEEYLEVRQNIIDAVLCVCEQYAADNVEEVELRTSMKCIYEGRGFEHYMEAVLEGIKQSEAKYKIKAFLMLSMRRRTPEADCEATVDLALKYKYEAKSDDPLKKVVGLDLSGSSIEGDGVAALKALKRGREGGLPIAIHTGESNEETAEQQAHELKELRPRRVGHTANMHDRSLLGDAIIEFCPSSFCYANMSEDLHAHPCFDEVLIFKTVVIGCDDLGMFPGAESDEDNVTLTEEIYRVAMRLNLSFEDVVQLQNETMDARFRHFIDNDCVHA